MIDSILKELWSVQQNEVAQKIIEYKKKIIEHNIPANNVLIHPDLLDLWHSTS